MVRTMGGAATAEGEADCTASGDGLGSTAGEGTAARWTGSPSLADSVGGTPTDVGAPLPGTAPLRGRSLAGPQLASASATAPATAIARRPTRGPRPGIIGLSLSIDARPLKYKCDTADDRGEGHARPPQSRASSPHCRSAAV